MNIDYNLYKIFLYLFEEKSISKTAAKLYVSQPAISYSLKELESQLGYTLFYRNSKGIEPTLEAKELYSYISTAFNIFNDAEEHIKNLNSLNIGTIRIGVPSHIGIFYLGKYITDFRKIYPGIKFEIVSRSTQDMIEMLENRKVDILIAPLPIHTDKKNIKKIAIRKLKNCFAYNKNLMKDVNIKTENDLKKYPLILPSDTAQARIKLDEYMESKNVKLDAIISSWTTEFMLDMVRSGMGLGYFIEDTILTQIDKDDFEIIDFNEKLPTLDVCCAYVDDFVSNATHKFIEMLIGDGLGE